MRDDGQAMVDAGLGPHGIHSKYQPAIYTHCYDDSGTRLFAAGGPLQVSILLLSTPLMSS